MRPPNCRGRSTSTRNIACPALPTNLPIIRCSCTSRSGMCAIWFCSCGSGVGSETGSSKGDLMLVYALVYAVGRFSLDFLRLDASQVLGVNFNQTIMGGVAVLALASLLWRHRPPTALRPVQNA